MGTIALSSLASSLAPRFSTLPGSGTAAALLPSRPSPQRDAAGLQPNQDQSLTEAFDRAVYRSLETRQAFSLKHSSAQTQLGQGGGSDSGSSDADQITFDFFQESRSESLSLFQKRSAATGANLDGNTQSSYFAASQEIAARFEFSVSISGAALSGFSKTADGASGSNELMDKLLEATDKLLKKADELFNQFFSQLDGTDGELNAKSLDDLFNEFVSGILDGLSGDLGAALGLGGGQGGQPANSGTAVQSGAVQLEFKFEFRASVTTTTVASEAQVQQGDPIVLDLDNDGIELSSYKNGARFDLLGKGTTQQTAFVNGGDAFLALDRNHDGTINSGQELFGEQHGAKNGFEELRRFDLNGDGVIDRNDAVYSQLQLFKDNGNGITEAGELVSLADAGIQEIRLGYQDVDLRAAGGNRIAQIASYLRNDGSRGQVADALLNYIA